jgi:NADPH-dependent curcumin reductase
MATGSSSWKGPDLAVVNRQVILSRRPTVGIDASTFAMRDGVLPPFRGTDVLVRVEWLSIEPAQMMFLSEPNPYGLSVPLGDVVWGYGLGEVVATGRDRYSVGDVVQGWMGWQELAIAGLDGPVRSFGATTAGLDPAVALVLGSAGLTAYFGLFDVGIAKAGETLVVTAAAGATGSMVVQLARISGCRVVGVTGSAEKCRWLVDVAGADAAIDHRSEDVGERLAELAPDGIDLCFDNVGGAVLDAILPAMGLGGRVVACGAISSGYGPSPSPTAAIHHYEMVAAKRLRVEGFMVSDFAGRHREVLAVLCQSVADGEVRIAVDILEGLDAAPEALARVFAGRNLGKQLVRL